MPTRVELDYFLANAARIPRPDQDATLTRLHRVTAPRTPRDEVFAFAFDHRNQFFDLAQQRRRRRGAAAGAEAAVRRRGRRDRSGAAALQGKVGMLCDDRYGQDALNAATGRGWWIGRPVELPGSNPLRVRSRPLDRHDAGRAGRPSTSSSASSHYHPDDADRAPAGAGSADPRAVRRRAGERPRAAARDHSAEASCRAPTTRCYRALKRLYNLGIYPEWWKLEPMSPAQWQAVDALIAERDPHCRGVVLLGLNASVDDAGGRLPRRARAAARAAASPSAARSSRSRPARGSPATIDDADAEAPACARTSRR